MCPSTPDALECVVSRLSSDHSTAPSPVLNTAEAARFLHVSDASLATWRCTKAVRIPYIRIGRRVLYRRADLERYLSALDQEG